MGPFDDPVLDSLRLASCIESHLEVSIGAAFVFSVWFLASSLILSTITHTSLEGVNVFHVHIGTQRGVFRRSVFFSDLNTT